MVTPPADFVSVQEPTRHYFLTTTVGEARPQTNGNYPGSSQVALVSGSLFAPNCVFFLLICGTN
jgi:hypothetical protein